MKSLFIFLAALCVCGALHGQENNSVAADRHEVEVPDAPLSEPIEFGEWRLGLDVGYSYCVGKMVDGVDSKTRDFLNKLRNGIYFGGDIHYFFPTDIGLGIVVSGRHYSVSTSEEEDSKNTIYLGPSLAGRIFGTKRRNALFLNFSAGYLKYSQGDYNLYMEKPKASIGVYASISYDIRLGKKDQFLGLKVGFISGSAQLGDTDYREDLSAIEIGAGLRF